MKVRLIKRASIEKFAVQHARSRSSFRLWLTLLIMSDWDDPEDIMNTFGSADLLGRGSERVVFDIAGNQYRMIAKFHFGVTRVHLYIKWIGTHAEYSKLCDAQNQYSINSY
jgi:mRNA interferase HigB